MQYAYEHLSRQWQEHAKKLNDIENAYQELNSYFLNKKKIDYSKPFDDHLRRIGSNLRKLAKKCLQEEDYGTA